MTILPLLLAALLPAQAQEPAGIEATLSEELSRAMAVFEQRGEPPYYVALAVEERETTRIAATAGTIMDSDSERVAQLDVELRVGSPELDSTHPLRGMSSLREDARRSLSLGLDIDQDYALRHAVWKELDARWRDAVERIVVVRANQSVKVEEEIVAPDFELREPSVDRREVSFEGVDAAAWEPVLARV